jgi:hypothetical protein
MTKEMKMESNPATRFAAWDLKATFPYPSPYRRALTLAAYWESFPDSYTDEQVALGVALLDVAAKGDSDEFRTMALQVNDLEDRVSGAIAYRGA